MQQENDQLKAQIEELLRENESLKQQNQQLQQELSNAVAPDVPQPDYEAVRDRVLRTLTSGKGKVATTSPQYKTAGRALDRFIEELRKSAPASTPTAVTAPDGTAAPLVEEATKKLQDKHYTKDEYYTELRQITERCGYRLFIDNTTLGRGRELFIVNPPGNAPLRVLSTQDIGEVVDWLRGLDLMGE